jgi:hypothetical protein
METHDHESREAQAAREVGVTDVGRGVAVGFTTLFLIAILAVPSIEIILDARAPGSPWSELAAAPRRAVKAVRTEGLVVANRRLLAAMTAFEDALNERSYVAARALSRFQWVMTRHLKAGNEQVVLGRRGWLYYRPGLDHVTGAGFLDPRSLARRRTSGAAWADGQNADPVPALVDFATQLADRGIALLVVPIPEKAALHPEGLARDLSADSPLENPSFDAFMDRLIELDILAYSPADDLANARRTASGLQWPLFLKTDTHWTPQGMESVAAGLAEFIARNVRLPESRSAAFIRTEQWVEGRGDLVALLRLPAMRPLFLQERVPTQRVTHSSGEPWTADVDADVLLLGDSFTNIYSQGELGWGDAAGLAEQLSFRLRRPLDKLAVNAGGPSAARERLASAIVAGQDRLAGKRLVVYAFAARELSSGDWRLIDLPATGQSLDQTVRTEPTNARSRPAPARGFVVWESNRGGDWRIWTRRLETAVTTRLSPNEPGRQHCCGHLSPDGRSLVYLSRAMTNDQYPEMEIAGELRLLSLNDGKERTLVGDARPYGWGNRAAVWRGNGEVIYIDDQGRTQMLNVTSGSRSTLVSEPQGMLAWLFDPTLHSAVRGSPSFSPYDAASGKIDERPRLQGCEPYFSHDGRFGFWVEGAGGPIRAIDLKTRATSTVLEHLDPRIPGSQRYAYFPMVSRDGRMFAFGASNGDHDHFKSNYDIFVAPIDPQNLQLLGRPVRMTSHPASDRYPDVHVETLDVNRWNDHTKPAPITVPTPSKASVNDAFMIRASLEVCSRPPSLREISPYRDALIVCEWSVLDALSGTPPGNRIRAAHWALRDGVSQPITFAGPGHRQDLRVEPARDRALFEGYPVFDTLKSAPGLTVYVARERE